MESEQVDREQHDEATVWDPQQPTMKELHRQRRQQEALLKQKPALNVQVRALLSGDFMCEVSAESDWNWYRVKHEIGELLSIPVYEQRLMLGQLMLHDQKYIRTDFKKGVLTLQVLFLRMSQAFAQAYSAVEEQPSFLKHVDDVWKADLGIALVAIRKNGDLLQHVSGELKANRELALLAIQQSRRSPGSAWQHVCPSLRHDKEFCLSAICRCPALFPKLPASFSENPDFILEAVQRKGGVIQYVPQQFQQARNIVMAAVERNPNIISSVLPEFRADREVVLTAVLHEGCLLKYASDSLRGDRAIVLMAVQQNWQAFVHAIGPVRQDRAIAFAAATQKAAMKVASFTALVN